MAMRKRDDLYSGTTAKPNKDIVTPNENVSDMSGDLYKDALANAKTQRPAGTANLGGSSNGTTADAVRTEYDDLRDQNYKNLLDTQIQLASAKQNASKAMGQQMAAQGLSGTGYSGVAANGLSNAYLNALASARQAYNDKDIDISATERQAEKDSINNTFNNISSLLQNATNFDDMKEILKGYGIDVNEDGTMSGDYYDSLDDESRKQLQIIYNLAGNKEKYTGNAYGDASSMLNGLTMENGESANQGGNAGIQDEVNELFNNPDRYNKEGMVVKLTNGNYSSTNVAYVIYHNGKWYQTTSSAYADASEKTEIKAGKWTGTSEEEKEDIKKNSDAFNYVRGRLGSRDFDTWDKVRQYCEDNDLSDDQINEIKKEWDKISSYLGTFKY